MEDSRTSEVQSTAQSNECISSVVSFFNEAEDFLNLQIPETLKNLLIINGFDHEIIMSNIKDSDIDGIVEFTRTHLHHILSKEELPRYYGIYSNNATIFEIIPGHRRIIHMLSDYYKQQVSVKQKSKRVVSAKQNSSQVTLQNINKNKSYTPINGIAPNASESMAAILLMEDVKIKRTSWMQKHLTQIEWKNWFLDDCKGKVSTHRLRRFVGNTKVTAKRGKNCNVTKQRKKDKYQCSLDSSKENLQLNELHESVFPENNFDNTSKKLDVILKKYYAVFYDDTFYIGRVIDMQDEKIKLKFLKLELDHFEWPRDDDIAIVDKEFLFYGPIEILGSSPFFLNFRNLSAINKQYKLMRSLYHNS
ncbi:uncharacterized protein [Prorops nasuta]|uniref:uncharacterized protein n=1 Tax=Prorops nasuta TaxID=863751 RepID=UPI0034CE21F2